MKNLPEKQLHYGEEVWTNSYTDSIRREECLCLHCNKMTFDKNTNCKIAQQIYELCCKENIAFIMTRCKQYDFKYLKQNKVDNIKCWREKGCPFNSNNSFQYMKCKKSDYSIEKCAKDNKEEWDKIDLKSKENVL